MQLYKPALTASFAIAVTSLELEAIFSPHLIASGTSWSTGKILLTKPKNHIKTLNQVCVFAYV